MAFRPKKSGAKFLEEFFALFPLLNGYLYRGASRRECFAFPYVAHSAGKPLYGNVWSELAWVL
jgi:hypothetical protein